MTFQPHTTTLKNEDPLADLSFPCIIFLKTPLYYILAQLVHLLAILRLRCVPDDGSHACMH